MPDSAQALPPIDIKGIDLPTVLAVDDRARLAGYGLSDQKEDRKSSLKKVRTIVLDPGHGGENTGAEGVKGVQEKYLTLELAYLLRDEIHEKYPDVRVVLTRYWDRELELSERIHFANMLGADVFLSLHYNAAVHNRAVGFETYFLETREATPGEQEVKGEPIATVQGNVTGVPKESKKKPEGTYNDAMAVLQRDLQRARQHKESGLLARVVNRSLGNHLNTMNRGVKQANFGVLRGALMPAIVIEAGFLTHPKEGEKVFEDNHQASVARALLESIEDFDRRLVERDEAK
ncbi:MAG: N-acetylmuramoyl-L-alanine amidase family protein [Myxococcota bacterium]